MDAPQRKNVSSVLITALHMPHITTISDFYSQQTESATHDYLEISEKPAFGAFGRRPREKHKQELYSSTLLE